MMSECSSAAQALRKSITERLESISSPVRPAADASDGDSQSLHDTNSHIKEILEKSIKEKLSDLEQALRQESVASEAPADDSAVTDVVLSPAADSVPTQHPVTEVVMPAVPESPQIAAKEEEVAAAAAEETGTCESVKAVHQVTGGSLLSPGKKKVVRSSVMTKRSGPKDRLTVDQVLKGLGNSATDSEKLQALAEKHLELIDTSRSSESHIRLQEKAMNQLVKEKEQLQSEHNRTVLAKSRLENLCRELQRQNKAVKEESLSRIKEEEERRREIANKFQSTLNEIMQLVQDNQQKNVLLKEENGELASKLKLLMDHYEIWEKNVEKIIEKKDLEGQLLTHQMVQKNLMFTQEKEQLLNEKQQLFIKIAELQKKGIEMNQKEMQLTSELALYTSKYQEFQDVLTKSNGTFSSFKKDMEKMSTQIKKLEKETIQWRNKFESCNKSLALVSSEKQKRDQEHLIALQKVDKLEKLCRALQNERSKTSE